MTCGFSDAQERALRAQIEGAFKRGKREGYQQGLKDGVKRGELMPSEWTAESIEKYAEGLYEKGKREGAAECQRELDEARRVISELVSYGKCEKLLIEAKREGAAEAFKRVLEICGELDSRKCSDLCKEWHIGYRSALKTIIDKAGYEMAYGIPKDCISYRVKAEAISAPVKECGKCGGEGMTEDNMGYVSPCDCKKKEG